MNTFLATVYRFLYPIVTLYVSLDYTSLSKGIKCLSNLFVLYVYD